MRSALRVLAPYTRYFSLAFVPRTCDFKARKMSVPAIKKTSSLCLPSLYVLLLPALLFIPAFARFSNNLFLQTCLLAAHELNQTNCWVCALMPAHQGSEFPLQAVPANISELLDERPGKADGLTTDFLEVQYEAAFPVCFQWLAPAGAPDIGTTTRCQETVTLSSGKEPPLTGLLPPELYQLLNSSHDSSSPSTRNFPLLHLACRVWKHPLAACLSVQQWEAQDDFFWVCGHRAYKQLPEVWTGSCALAHVVPAIRVSKERPAGRVRNARDLQQSTDIVNTYSPLTDKELYLSSIFPSVGVVRVGWAIYRLQAIIELLSNETSETLLSIATEQRELRRMALQNRMALDMILASHGGVCALVGAECCVYVPDSSEAVFDRIKHIAALGVMREDVSHDWLLEVKVWLGSWWGKLVTSVVVGILGLIFLVVLVKLFICVLRRSCFPTPQSTSIMPHMVKENDDNDYEDEYFYVLIDMYSIDID